MGVTPTGLVQQTAGTFLAWAGDRQRPETELLRRPGVVGLVTTPYDLVLTYPARRGQTAEDVDGAFTQRDNGSEVALR